jgi:branched-chain amino acid transport system permease protein
VIIAALPAVLPSFAIFQLTYVGAYAIAILGLIVLTGTGGQISLGHGAFLAVGGYLTALLAHHAGIGYGVAIPLAALTCAVLGIGLGFVALRLEGVYLALATFALAVAVPPTLKHFKAFTGGTQGITLPSAGDRPLYYVSWGIAGVLLVLTAFALRSGVGRSLRALRDNELAAVAFGIDPAAYKTLSFGWSAAYAGIAGALLATATAYVSPDTYGYALSFTLLAGAVLGGLRTVYGALVGAAIVEYLPQLADRMGTAAPSVVYGVAQIAVMLFLPAGIAGVVRYKLHRGARRMTRTDTRTDVRVL